MYRSIASYFRNRNLNDLADYFDGVTEGGFGSGYLAELPNGLSVVVTNRHVITFAESVTIIQSDENGTEVSVEDCPVVYEDENIDFALVLLPEGAFPGAPTIGLADTVPADGETVWSAGYPGLFGKPSWQLARGVVTNRRVVVDILGLPEYAVFTQHSAPIDPGNSGGPLLVGDPSDPSSFRVVGINTWVALGRQSSNFAISLDMLREAFERCEEATMVMDPVDAVRHKAENFVACLNSRDWSRFESRGYIASRMVTRQGWDVFTSLLDASTDADSRMWAERFLGESPEETLRQAIFFRIHEALYKESEPVVLEKVEELTENRGETIFRSSLLVGKKAFLVDWCNEAGNWRILEAGIPSAGLSGPRPRIEKAVVTREKAPTGGYAFPAGITIGTGVTSVPTIYGWEFGFREEIGYHFGFGQLASLGLCLVFDEGASLVEAGSQSTLLIFGAEAQGRIGFPILLDLNVA